jgi:hypothetical protein
MDNIHENLAYSYSYPHIHEDPYLLPCPAYAALAIKIQP